MIDIRATHKSGAQNRRSQSGDSSLPCKVLILADLSGSRNPATQDQIDALPAYRRLDKDTFELLFARLKVGLHLPELNETLEFNELDDLHPEALLTAIEALQPLRRLRQRLRSAKRLSEISSELEACGLSVATDLNREDDSPAAPGALLDTILDQPTATRQESLGQQLIREAVGGYSEAKRDPQLAQLAGTVDDLMGQTLRQTLQNPEFKRLEASWRSLDWLNRQVDTDRACQLYVLDVSKNELLKNLNLDQPVDDSGLYQTLLEQERESGDGFDVILADFQIAPDETDCVFVERMAEIAAAGDARLLLGTSAQFYEGQTANARWSQLLLDASTQLTLVAPGYMVRLPYGEKTSSVETLAFEELTEAGDVGQYLWGNSAYLLFKLMMDRLQSGQSVLDRVDNLPLHVFEMDDEEQVVPCTEHLLSDAEAYRLREQGLTVARAIKNQASVFIDGY